MGDLPMQSDVYAMTDLEFFDANPGAPEKLDSDSPDHADWIAAWCRIRDDVVNRMTDKAFFKFFPSAPQKLTRRLHLFQFSSGEADQLCRLIRVQYQHRINKRLRLWWW